MANRPNPCREEVALLSVTCNIPSDIIAAIPARVDSISEMGSFSKKKKEKRLNWSTGERFHDFWPPFFQKYWKKIFLVSCVLAVLLDPLFLYIPVINQDLKCLMMDSNLRTTALILRFITDKFYVMEILLQVQRLGEEYSHRQCSNLQFVRSYCLPTIRRSYILIDILAILPVPQVLIVSFFSKMVGAASSNTTRLIMNILVLLQYLPRVLRIYLSSKELRKTPKKEVLRYGLKVLGAVWYFFAIQRTTVCWQHANQNYENECDTSSFACHEHPCRNITIVNDLCPINLPNTTTFDFGIFTSVLQSDIPGSTNVLQKLSYCFCWGMRNLSSLGSNLQPSTNTWENLFVAYISITGMLLFLYLIGNLQAYMLFDNARVEANRHKMKVEQKMKEKDREVESWLAKNGIPERVNKDMRWQIMMNVQQELDEDRDADLDDILHLLPVDLQDYIKSCMPLTRLKQVPMLQDMDVEVLEAIAEHLQPIKYTNHIIIEEDEPLQMMLFIVDGQVMINEKRYRPYHSQRSAKEFYGEKLLTWPSWTFFPRQLPSAIESVKAIDDVEALVLTATDMTNIGLKFYSQFRMHNRVKEELINHLETYGSTIRMFSAEELRKGGLIGKVGIVKVYKGVVLERRNTVVAIEEFPDSTPAQRDLFVHEAIFVSQINHINVVKLLGFCLETEMPLLVFEYMENGTLHDLIHEERQRVSLDLRIKMAAEIASALTYLHTSFLPMAAVIHGGVTTTNILLDDNYMAKLSGLGSLQWAPTEARGRHTSVSDMQGTLKPEYSDPEYLQSKLCTEKSDVYSFGVVLAELLTSQKALFHDRPETYLGVLFVSSMDEGQLDQILDHDIVNEDNMEKVEKVANLAKRCLEGKGDDRPSMKDVTMKLEALLNTLHGDQASTSGDC